MSNTELVYAIIGLLVAILGGGGAFAVVIVKWMNRNNDKANAAKELAETESISVATLKSTIQDLRVARAEDQALLREVSRRINLLEERERHNLVRSAVHEAWDQLAFKKISMIDPTFPAPPSLANFKELEEAEAEYQRQVEEERKKDQVLGETDG